MLTRKSENQFIFTCGKKNRKQSENSIGNTNHSKKKMLTMGFETSGGARN
jgi:hypothetical protein